ncbi:MAG: hypothetical protein CMJ85_09455, partial [Planctomycetes bacterium]|nr:hypothetical protein [Planctomycetota bacterium]
MRAYVGLSGPGWLQSAITLGGGSLGSSLYLGVLAGVSMLWLQPVAMLLGLVMLSAISYVTLSTGERPFGAMCRHVSPVLAWGWALASLAANMVWALPQYGLATAVVQQNLAPGLLGGSGGKVIVAVAILIISIAVTWSYDRGRGVQIYERTLKVLVGVIVLCFFGVVVRLAFVDDLDLGAALLGLVPDLGSFSQPAASFEPYLSKLSEDARRFWSDEIVGMQRDVMISAAATAVGINMTFLLPYSLLRRGWNREFRGLARVDLGIGMLLPFVLATSCVVIASASRFHAKPVQPTGELAVAFDKLCDKRVMGIGRGVDNALLSAEQRVEARRALPGPDRDLAAMLVKRDAFDLANALTPLTGKLFANILFGVGVLAMALSTITLLMLISGFVICEMLGKPPLGRAHRLGTLAAATGVFGPFVWSDAAFYLVVPTSVFGMAL